MNPDYFDQLESELRSAVPRVAEANTRSRPRPRRAARWPGWLPRRSVLLVALNAIVIVAFGVALLGLLEHHHAPAQRSGFSRHRGARPGEILFPLGAVPTLTQLKDNFAVLRRPQTSADRSWHPDCGCGRAARQLEDLTRLTTTLPKGYRVFLDVEQFLLPGQLNMVAGSYVLNFTVVDPHGPTSSSNFGPNTGFSVRPISSGGDDAVWVSVVPDGVASVSWTFGCQGSRRCEAPTRTFTVPVVNNVAARQIVHADNCSGCASPTIIAWYAADGRAVASFDSGLNLAAPPFVKGGRGPRVLRTLKPNGIGGTRLGQSAATTVAALARLLGAPADTNIQTGGCGIDHETVWTSPATAEPLTVYERARRFVGYQYGAPVSEIGLAPGPGAVLRTPRGLGLGDPIGSARRLYRTGLTTSVTRASDWKAIGDGGTLRGYVLPITYPLHKVTAKNPVATIEAGMTDCVAPTP